MLSVCTSIQPRLNKSSSFRTTLPPPPGVSGHWRGKAPREMPGGHRDRSGLLPGNAIGRIDLLVIGREGFRVVDDMSFPADRRACVERVLGHGGQLVLYAETVSLAAGLSPAGCHVHLPLVGLLVRAGRIGGADLDRVDRPRLRPWSKLDDREG